MSSDSKESLKSSILTEEGKLRHENNFLKDRIANLEILENDYLYTKKP